MKHGLGWRPDTPDHRDRRYGMIQPTTLVSPVYPPHISLRSEMPPVFDQGETNSCTAFAIAAVLNYNRMKSKETPPFRPSELFIYYNERLEEGTIKEDAGAEIRTGMKCINKYGFCSHRNWPFVPQKLKNKPNARAYMAGTLYKAAEYYRLNNNNINELKACLVSGNPFIMGYSCFDSGEIADTNGGIIPMPKTKDKDLGGHAIVCCGYDDEKKLFQLHNSWGTECGDKGYYYLPYDYMTTTDLSDDFWTIRKIKEIDNE